MRYWLVIALLFGMLQTAQSQILEPVKWDFKVEGLESEGEFELQFKASIDDHWHLYSQHIDTALVMRPEPTFFEFTDAGDVVFLETVQEPQPTIGYDPNFELDIPYFSNEVVFRRKLRLKEGLSGARVSGMVNFMACDDTKCIFPDPAAFEFVIGTPAEAHGAASGILDPVDWSFSAIQVEGQEGVYDLVIRADIEEHWHLYSQHLESDFGPVPTSFSFADSTGGYELIGKTEEGTPKVSYDPNFEMDLSYFEGQVDFVQRIKVGSENKGTVSGILSFMVCDDSKCLPPEDVDFEVDLSKAKQGTGHTLTGKSTEGDKEKKKESDRSLWGFFFVAFLSGFAALLTPCVFPMIPLTVSFFTKQSKTRAQGIRNAVIYGLSIIILYVALGVGVSAIFGADVMHSMATNTWFNLFFFILLVVFAASFLGAFEITLPNSWINKADTASNRGGLMGIFFMAFTLALVSFSCTGPIVGTLLVEASQGGYMGPIIGMLGFSLAIALPFALFAAFPGWLNSLPQSGGWLNSVKAVLGFLELALAFKFLSNADLVEQWHLLERELFIAIWVAIFGILTIYLLGFIRLSHDSPMQGLGVARLFLAILTGMFTLYMIPGMWGAPTKLINAFAPPMFYSESPEGVGYFGSRGQSAGSSHSNDHPEGTHKGPQGIYVFHDYDEGMAHAKKEGLPVMLDFTGWACVNCRKMEENVWSDAEIKRTLSEDLVLISLYVDERIPLPASEQYEKELNGKTRKVRYVGDKWKLMQEEVYHTNSQPFYVLIDHKERQLTSPANYQDHGSIPVFKDWLKTGLSSFKK